MFSDIFDSLGDLFSVSSPVTASSDAFNPDVIKTDSALDSLGYEGMGSFDTKLRRFQADAGEKVDGIMNPGGPTENALSQTLVSQGLSTVDPLAKTDSSLPSHVTVQKNGDTGFTASASFGPKPSKPKSTLTPSLETTQSAKPKPPSPSKVDPITGLQDPLAPSSGLSQKETKEMAKVFEQSQKIQEAKTTQAALLELLKDERYQKKDPAYLNHVSAEFDRTYPGVAEADETGQMVQPKPALQPHQVKPYDPKDYLKQQQKAKNAEDQADKEYIHGARGRQGHASAMDHENQKIASPYPQQSHGGTARSARQQTDRLGPQLSLNAEVLAGLEAYQLADKQIGEGYQVADASTADRDWDTGNPERTWHPEQEKHAREKYARKNPEEMKERRLDRIEKNLRTGSKIGRAVGLDGAADDLDQFLDQDTSERHVSRDEAREDPFIQRAEETNRKNFETRTFLGKTGENHELNHKLRNLKEGESIRIKDYWEDGQSTNAEVIADNFQMGPIDGANNALRYGRQRFRTNGDLIATRRKNKVVIEGIVEHDADDSYDFHKDRIGDYLGAYDLQKAGRGKTHITRRRWKQKVRGTVNIKKNSHSKGGYDLVNPQFKWNDLE